MIVVPEAFRVHQIRYLRFYYPHRVDTCAICPPQRYHPGSSRCFESVFKQRLIYENLNKRRHGIPDHEIHFVGLDIEQIIENAEDENEMIIINEELATIGNPIMDIIGNLKSRESRPDY
jgi:hypothetical protein